MTSKPFLHAILSALMIGGLAACSSPPRSEQAPTETFRPASAVDAAAFAAPTELKGALVPGGHVDLSWKNNATQPGGVWVEFTTPGTDFVKLDPLWPETTQYRHPDVAPDAKYIYRLLPFFGRPSDVVTATTGEGPPEGTPNTDEEGPLPGSEMEAAGHGPKKSIRAAATIAEAAPGSVTAKLGSPTSVDVRWRDLANDEDGYLLEISPDPALGFQVCALLPPNTTSFKKAYLPSHTKCYFRVRAFFYGNPTEPVAVNTSPEKTSSKAN